MTELPKGWVETTLDCVAEWGSGGTPKATDRDYYGGGIPWAVIGDLNDATVASTAATISDAGLTNSSAKLVEPGTVLVAMYGSIGKLGIAGQRMATNQAIAFANGRAGLADNRFLFWFLRWQRSALATAGKGATQKNISQTVLKAWPIKLPPLPEQERIVAAIEEQLSRVDDASGLLRTAAIRTSALRAAALRGITPSECEWTPLGDVAEVVGGVTKDSKRQSDPAFVEVPYLRVANVQRGYLDLSEISTIRVSPERAKALALKPGDILFNEGGDRDKLGRGWVWSGEIEQCIHQNHVFRARIHSPDFDPKFVSMHGNTFGQRWFEKMGKQTTNLASINLKTLKAFPVPLLSLEEQRRRVADVEQQLSVLDALITAINHVLVRSAQLRRAVLDRAFTGQLVALDPNDQPASELLKRITVHTAAAPATRRRQRA